MPSDFDYFIVLAEMRTGSNFLETNLNAFEGVACHGEAFNPHFIGYPNRDQLLGLTQAQRDADNQYLWHQMPLRMEAEVIRDHILSVSGALRRQFK